MRRIARNSSGKPKGFAWQKSTTVYHATGAMQAILDEGFRTREQIGGAHVTGGGPSNAVSFTLNKKTARAIALGLRTIRGIGLGKTLLGDIIIQTAQVAPKASVQLQKYLSEERGVRSPEDVERVDRGMERFSYGVGPAAFKSDAYAAEVVISSGRAEFIDQSKYRVTGWAPADVLAEAEPERWGKIKDPAWKYRRVTYDAYRRVLFSGSWEHEIYDPVFFMTDIGPISRMRDEDIGVLRAKLSADWLCAEYRDAETLGYDPGSMTEPRLWASDVSSWVHGCEFTLGHPKEQGSSYNFTLPRGWDPPTREDTVVYLGAMSEIRVYDLSLIHDVREEEDIEYVLNSARDAWDRKGFVVDEPYFLPWHSEKDIWYSPP